MFTTNESCKTIILDWDYLARRQDIYLHLREIPGISITIITEESDVDVQLELELDEIPDDTHVTYPAHSEEDLQKFLRTTPWTFKQVFITSLRERISIANEIAIGTILAKDRIEFNDARSGADFTLNLDGINALSTNALFGGITGEASLFPDKVMIPEFSVGKQLAMHQTKFHLTDMAFDTAYSLGRYFVGTDPFKRSHHYTRLIQSVKNHPHLHKEQISGLIQKNTQRILAMHGLSTHYATYVPKKPADTSDRNAILLERLIEQSNFSSLLVCERNPSRSQKDAGSFANRKKNVKGIYKCHYQLDPLPVILFDDVYTSGETLNACAQSLIASGASAVIPLTLALSCEEGSGSPIIFLSCDCGRPRQISFNSKNGNPFWGCENWKTCKVKPLGFREGLIKLRRLRQDAELADIKW